MPTVRVVDETGRVKVAVVFEPDGPRPVWFQIAGREKVSIQEICAVWYSTTGAAKVINFEAWSGKEKYTLSFDTQALQWRVGRTVIE